MRRVVWKPQMVCWALLCGALTIGLWPFADTQAQQTKTGTTPPRRQAEQRPASRKSGATEASNAQDALRADAVPPADTNRTPSVPIIPLPGQNTPRQQNVAADPNLVLPPPFQLTEAEQRRVDQVLALWEKQNSKIDKFRCEFTRQDFDPVWGPDDHTIPKTISDGEIRYSAPDRGLFQIDGKNVREYSGQDPNGKPIHVASKNEFGEKWICDGDSIFEFDASQKILKQMKLPPEMRGKAIADGPLPFLFGASASKLKARYHVRELQPPANVKQEFWLEAQPRHAVDAAEFRVVRIAMDDKFLPRAMEIIGQPNPTNQQFARQVYQFSKVRINSPLDDLKELAGQMINSRTPAGWQKVVEDYGAPAPASSSTAQDIPLGPRVGQRPAPPAATPETAVPRNR